MTYLATIPGIEPRASAPSATAQIIVAVADHFGATPALLLAQDRRSDITLARHAAMWIVRRTTARSLPSIGRSFGGRDHTSVMHAIQRIDRLMAADPAFDAEMRALLLPFLPAAAA